MKIVPRFLHRNLTKSKTFISTNHIAKKIEKMVRICYITKQACHNVSVEKPEIFFKLSKARERRQFFKNPDSARDDHFKNKCPDLV